jgi:hypothetical protein
MTCSPGSLGKLAFDSDSTFDSGSEPLPILYETLRKNGRIVGGRGITGTRDQPITQTRAGSYSVGGRVGAYMAPDMLDNLLPRVLGATESADVFNVANTLPSFSTKIDRVGGVFQYDECKMARAYFQAAAGAASGDQEVARVAMDIIGQTESTDGISWEGTIPAFSTAANAAPYILGDAVITINSNEYEVRSVLIAIDNHLQARWVNSLSATEICPQDRSVVLQTNNPFTSTEFASLYALSGATGGVAGSVVFTNGNMSTTFTFNGLQWADKSPSIRGKRNIVLPLTFYAKAKSTNASVVVTHDSTA